MQTERVKQLVAHARYGKVLPLNDPFVALVRESGAMSISDIASKTGKSLPYVSVYVSDLQRRGIFSKTKEGRKTYIDLIKK